MGTLTSFVAAVVYVAAAFAFFGCVGNSLVRLKFSVGTLLAATAAACIALSAAMAL